MAKLTKAQFIAALAPMAVRARQDGSPLFPSVRLAQNILETGCNLNKHNNLGGFKVGGGGTNQWWKGATYTTPTWEVINGNRIETVATWRSYDSVYDFYRDQDRLFQNSRYERVRAAKAPFDQAYALQLCGYATDPQYGSKIISIIKANGLTKYDEVEDDEGMTAAEQKAFELLSKKVDEQSSVIGTLVMKIAAIEENLPVPKWFIKEFGEAVVKKISDPTGTIDFWRSLAVSLRVQGYKRQ